MSIALNCPACGKRYELDDALAGKKARCSGCGEVFRVPAGPSGSSSGTTSGKRRTAPAEKRDLRERDDHSWLEDGAEATDSAAPLLARRTQTTARKPSSGMSQGLLLGLGAAGLVIVGVIVGLLATSSGPAAKPAPDQGEQAGQARSAEQPAAPSLTDRLLGAVTGSSNPAADVSGYPQLGPLLPPCLPPPPLRDLSAHERETRTMIGYLGRMNDSLASVHDAASLRALGEQLKSQSQQLENETRQNKPSFRLTGVEEAVLLRRFAGDIRREADRFRKESLRISALPGLGAAGTQLLALITRLSAPMEMALKRAEGVKPRTGPEPYVEVYVQLANGGDEIVCRRKLLGLLESAPGIQAASQLDTKRASYRVWPVDDARAFARKITFGKATVKDRNIFVAADPAPAAEVAAARDAEKKEKEAREAAFAAARSNENPNDPKPPPGADEVTKALFALRSSNAGRRKEGVQRLYDLTPKDDRRAEVHKQLMPMLDDPDDFLVIDVMRSMARWRTDDTVPALIKKLDHPSHGVRWKAEEILGKLGDARAAGPLTEHLEKDGIAVEPALRALGPAAEPALIALLRNPEPKLRSAACDLLKECGGKDALETMLSLPADRDPLVQMAARSAMQAIRQRVGPVSPPRKATAKGKKS